MDNRNAILGIAAVAILLTAGAAMADRPLVAASRLKAIGEVEKAMFSNMVKNYLHPTLDAWGVALNTNQDSYLLSKIHVTRVQNLPKGQIVKILRDSKENANTTTWAQVRDDVKAAIDSNSTTETRGRISINRDTYVLTGIDATNATFSADIRSVPDFNACAKANLTAVECELASTKVGSLSLTRKTSEVNSERQRVWAGTMDFNSTGYTFVAVVTSLSLGV
jgi:hypothetical protein